MGNTKRLTCPYCWALLSAAEERAHTKGHVLAMCRTGDYTLREVAAELHISVGRVAGYVYGAGLSLKQIRATLAEEG